MTEFVRPIDTRFYDHPGFAELENAWSQVFFVDGDGEYAQDPQQALQLLGQVRVDLVAEYGYEATELEALESMACKYAQETKYALDIEREDLTHGN